MSSGIGKHISWDAVNVVCQAIIQILMMSIYARYISPAEFGVFAVASVFIAFVTLFATDGISSFLVQEDKIDGHTVSSVAMVSLIFGVVLFGLSYYFAGFVASQFESEESELLIQVLSLSLIINAISLPVEALLQRDKQFKTIAKLNISSFLFGYFFIGLASIFSGLGVWSIVFATLSQAVIKLLLLIFVSFNKISFQSICVRTLKKIIKFSSSMMSIKFVQYLILNTDKVLVGKKLGLDSMGILQMYIQIILIPSRYIGKISDSVIFSHMSRMNSNKKEAKLLYMNCLKNIFIIFFPVVLLLAWYGQEFLLVFLGEDWAVEHRAFSFLAISILFRLLYRINNTAIRAFGDLNRSLVVNVIFLIVLLVAVLVSIQYGLTVVSFVVALSYLFANIMQLYIMNLYMSWKLQDCKVLVRSVIVPVIISILSIFLESVFFINGAPFETLLLVALCAVFLFCFSIVCFKNAYKGTLIEHSADKFNVWWNK